MGWSGTWNSWFGAKTDDPLSKLDPNVRKFLEQESPVKVSPAQRQQEAAATKQQQADAAAAQQKADDTARARAADPNAVPEESLFPDGRYAHLWKTYRPLGEIEAETKTDQEKLHDVLDAFKARKTSIGRSAVENCADEQLDWNECMRSGSMVARMYMCRDEVRKFESCYNMQTRLLKALGYLNAVNSSPEMEERIQLHADKLYHQMLEQQEAIEVAKTEGRPIPKFEPIVPKAADSLTLMSDSARKKEEEKLATMSDIERAAEQAAVDAEMRSKHEMVAQINELWKTQAAERKARLEKGEGTTWDKMATAWQNIRSRNDKKD